MQICFFCRKGCADEWALNYFSKAALLVAKYLPCGGFPYGDNSVEAKTMLQRRFWIFDRVQIIEILSKIKHFRRNSFKFQNFRIRFLSHQAVLLLVVSKLLPRKCRQPRVASCCLRTMTLTSRIFSRWPRLFLRLVSVLSKCVSVFKVQRGKRQYLLSTGHLNPKVKRKYHTAESA